MPGAAGARSCRAAPGARQPCDPNSHSANALSRLLVSWNRRRRFPHQEVTHEAQEQRSAPHRREPRARPSALSTPRGEGGARRRRRARRGALERVVAEIRAAGGTAHGLAFDVGDKHAAHRITGAASALVGPIDLLIHNASTLGPTPLRLLLDTECEDLEQVLAVNLIGPFRLDEDRGRLDGAPRSRHRGAAELGRRGGSLPALGRLLGLEGSARSPGQALRRRARGARRARAERRPRRNEHGHARWRRSPTPTRARSAIPATSPSASCA